MVGRLNLEQSGGSSSMNLLGKLGIIFIVCLAGEAISKTLPFPFPGSIISMMLLLVLLLIGAVKLEHVDEPTQFFLSNLLFFFIPAGVGMIRYLDVIRDNFLVILIINIGVTVLTFIVTAYTIKLVLRLQRRGRKGVSR